AIGSNPIRGSKFARLAKWQSASLRNLRTKVHCEFESRTGHQILKSTTEVNDLWATATPKIQPARDAIRLGARIVRLSIRRANLPGGLDVGMGFIKYAVRRTTVEGEKRGEQENCGKWRNGSRSGFKPRRPRDVRVQVSPSRPFSLAWGNR